MAFRYSGSGWRVAHSIKTFGDQIMDFRGHTNSYPVDGTLGDTAHSNRVSDHNRDANGIVRALDFFEHETGFVDEVFESMRLARDPRLKYAIHDERMFASYSNSKGPAWEWREYTGVNGHINHGHLSVVGDAIADQNHLWEITMPLSDDDVAKIANAVANVKVSRAGQQVSWLQETADIKTLLLGLNLDSRTVSDAELDAAVDELIAALPDATVDRLRDRLS